MKRTTRLSLHQHFRAKSPPCRRCYWFPKQYDQCVLTCQIHRILRQLHQVGQSTVRRCLTWCARFYLLPKFLRPSGLMPHMQENYSGDCDEDHVLPQRPSLPPGGRRDRARTFPSGLRDGPRRAALHRRSAVPPRPLAKLIKVKNRTSPAMPGRRKSNGLGAEDNTRRNAGVWRPAACWLHCPDRRARRRQLACRKRSACAAASLGKSPFGILLVSDACRRHTVRSACRPRSSQPRYEGLGRVDGEIVIRSLTMFSND